MLYSFPCFRSSAFPPPQPSSLFRSHGVCFASSAVKEIREENGSPAEISFEGEEGWSQGGALAGGGGTRERASHPRGETPGKENVMLTKGVLGVDTVRAYTLAWLTHLLSYPRYLS